ncbi:MAG: hypothetical protein KTR31_39520 [Myxococcales bacterium]|nr:hypothetical protein [Myxococcales bacterium]
MIGVWLWWGCAEPSPSLQGPGLHQQVRVHGAQLRRGPIGADAGGPEVSQVLRPQPEVFRGEATVQLGGRLAPRGVALHLQAEGDADHWVLAPRGFDFVVADELQFAAELEFSHAIQTDEVVVRLAASDEQGRLGPTTQARFLIADDVPAARLMVSLGWDAPVDLDLHVMDPAGVVIGAKNINSYEVPPGQLPPPDAWMEGGYLDYDSNQQCRLDLRNRENVLWLTADPAPGDYRIFAHLFAPCGQPVVNLEATAHLEGELLVRVGATQYPFDSRIHWAEGEVPGLLLAEFTVP